MFQLTAFKLKFPLLYNLFNFPFSIQLKFTLRIALISNRETRKNLHGKSVSTAVRFLKEAKVF
jgi:hypothetical protein